jgi:hypothetical protein
MRSKSPPFSLFLSVAGILPMLLCSAQIVTAGDYRIEAQLIWGTTNAASPNAAHKPVAPAVGEKLKQLPLKWTHYFTVTNVVITLPAATKKREALSPKCDIEVRDAGKSKFEVALFGKGAEVFRHTQALPKGEVLLLGGNAPNATCWLVALKRIE